MRKCRRCEAKPTLTDADIEKMVREVTSMSGVKIADEETFKKRFSVCADCPKLEYGTTCMMCGCVMQVRARLLFGKCPKGLW